MSVNPNRVSLTEVFIWSGAGYLGFAIELLGSLLSHAHYSWKLSPSADYIRTAVIVFTALSPFPALYALSKAQRALREAYSPALRVFLWTFAILGVFVSLAESMWTCSGHPTWLLGYDG